MTTAPAPHSWSTTQIMLHWSVATLVVFQFFVNDGIMDAWHAYAHGEPTTDTQLAAANIHVTIGLVILVLALWRVALRFLRGAPPAPANEPSLMRLAAGATHIALYALIVIVPASGAAAWFLGSEPASAIHGLSRVLLFLLACLHIAAALVQAVVFRSGVLTRMLMAKD